MSIALDRVSIKGLRHTHFEQLLWYIEYCEREEVAYGNKKQFDKRHNEVKEWLNSILKIVKNKGGENEKR